MMITLSKILISSIGLSAGEEAVSLLQVQAVKKHSQEPSTATCKESRKSLKEQKAAYKDAKEALAEAKAAFLENKELIVSCKKEPKLPKEMCGLKPGEYTVTYYNPRGQTGHFMCDGSVTQKTGTADAWASYGGSKIACDDAGLSQRCKSGGNPENQAVAYVLNTWGNGKYECLYMDGDNIKGKHYTGMHAYWGPITYGAKAPAECPKKEKAPKSVASYIGCYADDGNRDLQDGPMQYGYTVASCAATCSSYKFFALQNGGWCVCGNAYATASQYTKRSEGECGGACNGETAQDVKSQCGGAWRNSVYSVNSAALLQTSEDQSPPQEQCKDARASKKELKAALKAARKARKAAKVAFKNTKEIVAECKPEPKLPKEMCGLTPGRYTVTYYNPRQQEGLFECDGTVKQVVGTRNDWANYGGSKIACDEAGLTQRCKSGSRPDNSAVAYVMNTWGNGKYECLSMDGDNIKGTHYTGMHAYWGPITYGAKTPSTCDNDDVSEKATAKFIGCYVDDGHRDLQDGPKQYGYTVASCKETCSAYKYFALQNGGWCVCGNAYATASQYSKRPDGECGGACNGETATGVKSVCGGGWRNAVYEG